MLYMVIERFKPGAAVALYRRAKEQGRMVPDGLEYVASWVDLNFNTCFQLMRTEDEKLFEQWCSRWQDLTDFEIVQVRESAEAFQLIKPLLHSPFKQPCEQDFDDRQKWDRVWSSQSHRNLNMPLKVDLPNGLPFGSVVSATISEDPPEFSNIVYHRVEECPVCGQKTSEVARRAAYVHPKFENGVSSISFGVWVHEDCYERCAETGNPAPIPW
ncbi:MAG: DUF3303 family protein [Acidobacteriota bacterium]